MIIDNMLLMWQYTFYMYQNSINSRDLHTVLTDINSQHAAYGRKATVPPLSGNRVSKRVSIPVHCLEKRQFSPIGDIVDDSKAVFFSNPKLDPLANCGMLGYFRCILDLFVKVFTS